MTHRSGRSDARASTSGRSLPLIPCRSIVHSMQSIITGKAYVLGDNVDTDQIIPAQYLSFNPAIPEERKFFGMYAMSSVPQGQRGLPRGDVPFVRENEFR